MLMSSQSPGCEGLPVLSALKQLDLVENRGTIDVMNRKYEEIKSTSTYRDCEDWWLSCCCS